MTSMMSRFKSNASVSMATGDQQRRVIKKRKQDDTTVNLTVTGLYSSSDHTLTAIACYTQIHVHTLSANMLHTHI